MKYRGEIHIGEEYQATNLPSCNYTYEHFEYAALTPDNKKILNSILLKKDLNPCVPDDSQPLCIWNPDLLSVYEVSDYLHVAKKYFSKNLRHQEDIMLMWLVMSKYDIRKALVSLK